VADIKSEPWPASNRNRWPDSYWNAWAGFVGIRTLIAPSGIRSFFSTAKKQGWNIINGLTQDPSGLAKSLRLS
jgi:hypothetical protein